MFNKTWFIDRNNWGALASVRWSSLCQDFPSIRLLNSTYACDLDQNNYVYLYTNQLFDTDTKRTKLLYSIWFIDLVWRDCNLIFKIMKAMVKSEALVARNYIPPSLFLIILFTFLFSINLLFFSSLFPDFKCFRG